MRHLIIALFAGLAACSKTPAPPAPDAAASPAPETAPPSAPDAAPPSAPDAAAPSAPDAAATREQDALVQERSDALVPAPSAPSGIGEQYVVWTSAEGGYRSAWIAARADGAEVLATRDEAVLFDGVQLLAVQPRYTPFREVGCEYVLEEVPEGTAVKLGPTRYYPYMIVKPLGAAGAERELVAAYDGRMGNAAADGKPATYWGEHWGRSIQLAGGFGSRLFLVECDGGYGCGAHGEQGCSFVQVNLTKADAAALDLTGAANALAERVKPELDKWIAGSDEEVTADSISLDAVWALNDAGALKVDYVFVAGVSYAATQGDWGSYTQSLTYKAEPVPALGFPEVPAAVRDYLAKQPAGVAVGWSVIPATTALEAQLAAFKDPSTLAPPKPVDETAEGQAAGEAKLGEGRKATREKRWADAVKAFDEAIAGAPTLARAWSGRGYAKLLAGDLDGAKADFDKALELEQAPKFQAAVWFNLGELALRKKDEAAAKAAFTRANALAPSDAAKKQLDKLK